MRFTLPKLLASLAALGAVSAIAVGGTYANFTATPVTISSNAFTAGSLTMTRSGSGVIFDLGNAKIGQEATGSVTINNTGTLPGTYTLDGSSSGALAPSVNLKIYKDTDNDAASLLYDGALSGIAAAGSISLGTFAATTGSHTFYFHVTLPTTGSDAGDNALQGETAGASFTWKATQV
jgi:predicted ribosomally synthesized peptide with SipW-like signal peptide